jgi:drug/metabolite transporter (DMT)-like permease
VVKSSVPSTFNGQVVLLGTSSAACWGISTVMTKGILADIPPLTLLVIQLIGSNAFLWAVVKAQKLSLPPLLPAVRYGLPGLLQPGLAFITGIIGLSLTTASVEALIWSTETLMIIGLAWLILGERIGLPLVALSLLGFWGVVLVNFTGEAIGNAYWGNLLIFIGTFCAALYTVLVRKRIMDLNPLVLVTLNQSMGLVAVLGVWGVSQFWSRPGFEMTPQTWGIAVVSGLLLHAVPFWLFTLLLQKVEASLAGLFLILIPLFTISGASLFLGETLTSMQWMGAGLILVTMAIVSWLYKE